MKNYLACFFLLITPILVAQVGIGTSSPHPSTSLHITNVGVPNKGVLIAPMTSEERDAMAIPAEGFPNGLLIFNITENCFNFWNINKWVSFCGDIKPAKILISKDQLWSEQVFGDYNVGESTNNTNYVEVSFTVLVAGKLNLQLHTGNGYSFSYTNNMIYEGDYKVVLNASGVPSKVQTDLGVLNIDLAPTDILIPIHVKPILSSNRFVVNCETLVARTRLTRGVPSINDFIEVDLSSDSMENVNYSLHTNVVNGVSFSGVGVLPGGTFRRTVKMIATGTPISSGLSTFNVQSNSTLELTDCDISIKVFLTLSP